MVSLWNVSKLSELEHRNRRVLSGRGRWREGNGLLKEAGDVNTKEVHLDLSKVWLPPRELCEMGKISTGEKEGGTERKC